MFVGNAGRLPQLVPEQVVKLKQLSVLTLAETNKSLIVVLSQVLPYDQLMQELDVMNVRELEDFLINECMYAGIVRGKLDQLRRCFEVQFAAGRDLRPGQLGSMIQTLSNWLATSDNLLISIQEKIKWADSMSELDKKHRKEVEDRVEDVKKSISLKKASFFWEWDFVIHRVDHGSLVSDDLVVRANRHVTLIMNDTIGSTDDMPHCTHQYLWLIRSFCVV
uniref:PCI domain-containing protein n=1 Tax=Quercus lobata TaxID=97700 RepID=A0A7N2KXK5_QUELO